MQQVPALRSHRIYQGYQYVTKPYRFLDRCFRRFGDTFWIHPVFLPRPTMVVTRRDDLISAFGFPETTLSFSKVSGPIFGFLPDGAVMRLGDRRHTAAKATLQSRLRKLASFDFCDAIGQIIDRRLNDRFVDLRLALDQILSRVCCLYIYGEVLQESDFQFLYRTVSRERRITSAFHVPISARLGWRRSPKRINPGFGSIRQHVLESLRAEHFASSSLLAILSSESDDEDEIADRVTEAFSFLYGTLTSSASHAAFALLTHGEARRQLTETFREDDASSMDVLDRFIREVWRLYPDVPMTFRYATSETSINGKTVPQGCIVAPCIYLAHRHPQFVEAPDEFHLERTNSGPSQDAVYMPGGSGERQCPGLGFAAHSLREVLSALLHRFQITPLQDPGKTVRMTAGAQALRTGKMPTRITPVRAHSQ
ncbi:MAG: cytochrome P450 [Planctomycetota bacterium]